VRDTDRPADLRLAEARTRSSEASILDHPTYRVADSPPTTVRRALMRCHPTQSSRQALRWRFTRHHGTLSVHNDEVGAWRGALVASRASIGTPGVQLDTGVGRFTLTTDGPTPIRTLGVQGAESGQARDEGDR
jgi:hypothetical protein